ncbi:MAG TPA: ethanolamine permease [Polyangiaceae bacterium]|nr:ethanolamine permease [Polyangiaceae bacterium]
MSEQRLAPRLGTWQLWGLAVGLVISGEYFGWSYGWASAGTLGFLVSTVLVAVFYLGFVLAFTELAAALPDAGGGFAYAQRALGPRWGFVAGIASLVELVFAPPAIALSIGSYLHVQFPGLPPTWAAVACYVVFMGLNARGVILAANFELLVTILAIVELCIFIGLMAPTFSWEAFSRGGWAGSDGFSWRGVSGICTAIPFAIWFFLAIEGAALAVEETRDPARSVPRAFSLGIATLMVLAFGVMFAAGGSGDWTSLADRNDPLPEALKRVVGPGSRWLHMLVWIGLFGLVASFHGILLGYSRQIFSLARAGFLPGSLARLHPRYGTPQRALLAGGLIGMASLAIEDWLPVQGESLTARLVTLSVLGALTLYVVSLFALLRLRRNAPDLVRPFEAPGHPWLPLLALGLGLFFLVVVVVGHPGTAAAYAALLGLAVAFRSLSDR